MSAPSLLLFPLTEVAFSSLQIFWLFLSHLEVILIKVKKKISRHFGTRAFLSGSLGHFGLLLLSYSHLNSFFLFFFFLQGV